MVSKLVSVYQSILEPYVLQMTSVTVSQTNFKSYKMQVMRVITDDDYLVLTPIDKLSSKLGWSSLEEKQTRISKMMLKIMNGKNPAYLAQIISSNIG